LSSFEPERSANAIDFTLAWVEDLPDIAVVSTRGRPPC